MDNGVISPKAQAADTAFEQALRPNRLQEFFGQDKVRENLSIMMEAAKARGEALDHILIFGSDRLGKSTLAEIIAYAMGISIKNATGSTVPLPGDLAAVLTNMRAIDILFINEIHRLSHQVEEVLCTAMESGLLSLAEHLRSNHIRI